MENADRTENASFDQVGRRLQKMLEAVKIAKNIAKPVQQALAEALDAFKHAKAARMEQQEARACLVNKMTEDQAKPEASRSPDVESKNSSNIDPTLIDISQELKALRKEVGDIRSAQVHSSSTEDGGTWSEVFKKKPTTKKPRTDQGAGDIGNDVRLVKSVKIDKMDEQGKLTSWTEVVKTKKKGKSDKPATKPAEQASKQRRGFRPPAILVDVSKEDFPELAKKIRDEACVDVIGNCIVGMRQAKSGGLLIEVRGSQEEVSVVRAEIARSAGADIGVRTLQQRELIEVRNLDKWSDGPEVQEPISSASGCDLSELRLVSMRKRFGGVQLALISAPMKVTQAILRQGRLRVGVVSCSVRHCEAKARCFRCLAYGHEAKSCQGPDRSKCCRRCEQDGHFAITCAATQEDAQSFAKSLAVTHGDEKAASETTQPYRAAGMPTLAEERQSSSCLFNISKS